ncbi:hypothetical protein [Synechococcus elongatus]|uniref:Uncharacterized protein n=1 Tax=Synechococcus elongatus PCC 11802 TaxID=2283154 RepID=A0AAT9K0Y3_SYNEL|nr:hypothetical protein [Synechococcus elongatus]QFZ91345.1 hypothetical protein EKO22_02135 [Synechococcus elongatus PCC 11802]
MSSATAPILKAKLLEFLKFRVLAAQEEFFDPFLSQAALQTGTRSPLDAARLRQYLQTAAPSSLQLSDTELIHVFEQARTLYVN